MAKRERWIAGGRLARGDEVALRLEEGRVAAVARHAPAGKDIERIDLRGHWLAPFAVDAHVHLAFAAGLGASDVANGALVQERLAAVERQLLAGGVAGAIDLGAPRGLMPGLAAAGRGDGDGAHGTRSEIVGTQSKLIVEAQRSPERWFSLAQSGPLLCAPGGYPTQSWGRDGYGLAIATPGEAREAVSALHREGATFAKLALDARYPVLSPEVAKAVVLEARKLGMKSAAHALDVAAVRAALDAQVDVLAHTPVEPLPDALVHEAGARKLVVLSTLAAFGSTSGARENLARLAAAGCRPIYGTDLGNEGTSPGLSADELHALVECGFSCARILAMCTSDAASLLGDSALGHLGVGARACFLVLGEDPARDPAALCRPAQRYVDGQLLAAN